MSRVEDDAVEFRAGTLNDLLEAAKGGRPQTSADVQRYRSLAIGGAVSSALLAVALVAVLLTGVGGKGGSKGQAEATGTTTTTVAALPAPPGMPTFRVPLDANRVPSGLKPCARIGFTDGQATIENALILAVNRETRVIAGISSTTVILDVAVPAESRGTMTQLLANRPTLQTFGGEAPATPCPAAPASG